MEDFIVNSYGRCHLSKERTQQFINIVDKHHKALLLELREHKIIPAFIALEKTTVWELDDIIEMDRLRRLNNKNI